MPRTMPVVEYLDLLESPWAYGGRWTQKGDKVDCWGVVVEIGRRLGIEVPDPFRAVGSEDSQELSEAVLAEFAEGWDKVRLPTEPGDVATFHSFAGSNTHAAVHLGGGWMLQAGNRLGGVQCLRWDTLKRHATAVWRLKR